jgi:cohesin loading factor subunit SCC2
MVICNVAKILELVVPLMEHPSETFLATIEEDLMKLIIKYGMTVSIQFTICILRKENTLIVYFVFYLQSNIFSIFQVVQHCVSCLGAVVNKVTQNFKFVWACFNRYYGKFSA